MATDPAPPSGTRPRGVHLIAVILVLEALGLVLLAAGSVVTVFADPVSVGASVFMTVLLLLVAASLVAMAGKLLAGFRWPRSPSLVVQLFLVILAFPYFDTGNPLIGLALMVPAALVIVALFSRPVVQFTVRTTGAGKAL